ncbi:hypothetical protein QR46_1254 [Giardia duodenalis assemblage B]|uniref:Uncharacterized protein n=3 Tax=Giardia intestinalis TaxID=5741 RepID=A0A132NYI6_GIAIN|nr:Hypothetical protein GSB_151787 [Giardia intestinalis]KWX14752.1 hypothetical protein QR46_1254 [Giardia intestinalis assemblage B]
MLTGKLKRACNQNPKFSKTIHRATFMSRRIVDEDIVIGQRIKPMSREERRALQDRDYMEKLRLAQRREDYCQYEDPGFINHASQNSAAYIDEHHRFADNILDIERNRREEERLRRENYLRARGEAAMERSRRIAERVEAEEQEKQDHLNRLRERGNTKNLSGANFNLLTHEYNSGADGEQAAREDERARERAELRRRELARRGGYGYNPLTGEYINGL